jgi:SAM-dependent methyltransferase
MRHMLEATARSEARHFWFRGLRRFGRGMLDGAYGGARDLRILDCGAGTGYNLGWLEDYGWAMGVELSETGLSAARSAHRRIVQASVAALPCPDGVFDLVTSFDVLYCLPDDEERQAIREMWRVLKPGGRALVNVAALDSLRGSHSVLTREVRRYTRAGLAQKLVAAGFRIERITSTNLSTLPIAFAVRLAQRLRGSADVADDADLRTPIAVVNEALTLMLACEAWCVRRGITMLIGSSVMCLVRK